jgi:hypothetical protein
MVIPDKVKNKAFDRCFNKLKKSHQSWDYSMIGPLSKLRLQRDEIIAKIPLPASEHNKELEKYEATMCQEMEVALGIIIQDGPVKEVSDYRKLLERTKQKVIELKSKVSR